MIKYIPLDRTSIRAYLIRTKVYETERTPWVLRFHLKSVLYICNTIGTHIKVQVRDLHYMSSNLYHNCIISYMVTKWTDHAPGICGWSISMASKGLGIRKCISLGLASCLFTMRCNSIIICSS